MICPVNALLVAADAVCGAASPPPRERLNSETLGGGAEAAAAEGAAAVVAGGCLPIERANCEGAATAAAELGITGEGADVFLSMDFGGLEAVD